MRSNPLHLLLILGGSLLLTACEPQQSPDDTAAAPNPPVDTPDNNPTATFPAQQRALADPETIARGEALYGISCRSCHGQDLRGGDMGGPNLLRSQVMLSDENGEQLIPVVQNGRNTGLGEMPPQPLPDEDIVAIAQYIHSVVAQGQPQGAPPPGEEVELDIVVGDPAAGETYFNQECSGCHSVTGDLAGIVSATDSAENLQNSWVAGRRWGASDPDADRSRRDVKVEVTLDNGTVVSGVLKRRDDFTLAMVTDAGVYRSFSLDNGADPGVENIQTDDPLARHRELLAELTDDIMHNVTAYLVTIK